MDIVFDTEQAVFNYRVAGIWIQNGHVLLHRSVNDNHWSLPGGRVSMNEDTMTSIQREFLEELGAEVKVERLLWVVENFFTYVGRPFHEIGFYYSVSCEEGYVEINDTPFFGVEGERLVYRWTPLEEIEDLILYPSFLRSNLLELPQSTQHLVVRQ